MRSWMLACVFICAAGFGGAAWAKLDVVFFNPGAVDDSFWGDVDQLMLAASTTLDIKLDIIHSDRNHFKMITQLDELLASAKALPNYVILVNEKQSAIKMLQALYPHPVYVQLILNDISPGERDALLQDPHWQEYLLPAIIPDNYAIGSATAKALMDDLEGKAAKVLLISGDKSTPASVLRTQGASDYFFMQSNATLTQTVYGQWSEAVAYGQALTLLNRYPDLNVIWTASDRMAIGVLKALKEKGLVSGKDVFVGTINTSPEILQLCRQHSVSVIGGGHFLVGALGLVELQYYQQHKKYLPYDNVALFGVLQPDSAFYQMLVARDWPQIFQSQILNKLPLKA
ncbi:ABC transporter substrate-binding protein [Shewanella oncorhynchi]|uniref:ABC transporter substrate-binding protein n=1 Tax=Shewanella oncorhynchi TaxID=2726434 RepID=UPI003D7B2B63